jgi:hypothetical protein
MNKRIFLDIAITLAIVGYPITPAIAVGGVLPQTIAQPANPPQPNPDVTAPGSSAPQSTPGTATPGLQPSPGVTIPATSAVSVTFCSTVKFNVKQKSGFPVTVYLTRPIMDSNGNQLVPVNSLVSAQLKPTREGVQIKAENLVVSGRVVPIQTSVLLVPMLSNVSQEDYYAQEQNPGLPFQVANNLQDWLGDQGILSGGTSDLLGFGLAVASGVSTGLNKPKRTETMEVPQGSTFVLQLLSPVDVPPMVDPATSSNSSQPVSLCSEDVVPTQGSSSESTPDNQESRPDDPDDVEY